MQPQFLNTGKYVINLSSLAYISREERPNGHSTLIVHFIEASVNIVIDESSSDGQALRQWMNQVNSNV